MTEPSTVTLPAIARRARIRVVRASLAATVLIAAALYAVIDARAAQGALLGGIAGALGFWSMSLRLERVAIVKPARLQAAATLWTFSRLVIYFFFLFFAYRIDPAELHGLMGAIAGLLSTRFVAVFIAIRDSRAAVKPDTH